MQAAERLWKGVATVAEQSLEEWDFLFDVNVRGLMQCMKAELQVLQSGGALVNACSIAALSMYTLPLIAAVLYGILIR